jgi:aryl-alcohol dehydrogenase-like predicted oxidoreductase
MIGSWLKTIGDRESVIVATKIGKHPDAPGLSQRNVLRAVEASLARLDTDYIDFLSFNGDDPETPIEEGLEAVDRLMREGKVRFLSAAGFPGHRVREIQALAEQAGYPRFRALVTEYSLMQRAGYEGELQELATRAGRAALARQPLAEGYLTGDFRTKDDAPHSVMFAGAMQHIGRRGGRVLEALDGIAEETGSTPASVALAWVLVKPGIAAAVVQAKDEGQLELALGALDVPLARHHVALLDKVSAY